MHINCVIEHDFLSQSGTVGPSKFKLLQSYKNIESDNLKKCRIDLSHMLGFMNHKYFNVS